jgi:phosphoribosylanthranilate isomerase
VAVVKICGVTSVRSALACAELGVSAIGLHFGPQRPASVDVGRAREISRAVRGRTLVVGVASGLEVDALRALWRDGELGCLQLGGEVLPDTLEALLPHAYPALRIDRADDIARAERYAGDYLLTEVNDPSLWPLLRTLATRKKLTLAGRLTERNLAAAIAMVGPYCVNLEAAACRDDDPREHDPEKIAALLDAARGAVRSPFRE